MANDQERAGGVGVDRRGFLAGAAGAVAGAALGGAPRASAQPDVDGPARARNLIFLTADGVGPGALSLGDVYARRRLGRPMRWIDLIASPDARRALVAVDPADWILTDSAASASSWSIGERVNVDAVSVTPDGRRPTPLLARAKQAGYATGVITTTEFTDASPAAMVANAARRGDAESIVQQFLERGVDLVIAGGGRHLDDETIRAAGVTPFRDARAIAEACRAMPGRLFALLDEGECPFEIDRPEGFPTLAEQARAGIERMARTAPDGFVLFIESEDTDTTAHMNDAASFVRGLAAFDDAVGVALDFAAERDDTLVVVTSDHATGNPGFARYAPDGQAHFDRMCEARGSFRAIVRRLREIQGGRNGATLASLLRDVQGVELTDREVAVLDRWLAGEPTDPYNDRSAYYAPLGSVVGNHFGVAFASYRHTTDYVELTDAGPGADGFLGARHHVDVHTGLIRALGLV
ncbi:MAG: alkaline phosphatase [Phycisphaerales bacterium]